LVVILSSHQPMTSLEGWVQPIKQMSPGDKISRVLCQRIRCHMGKFNVANGTPDSFGDRSDGTFLTLVLLDQRPNAATNGTRNTPECVYGAHSILCSSTLFVPVTQVLIVLTTMRNRGMLILDCAIRISKPRGISVD
jgi:hypothetical protein